MPLRCGVIFKNYYKFISARIFENQLAFVEFLKIHCLTLSADEQYTEHIQNVYFTCTYHKCV